LAIDVYSIKVKEMTKNELNKEIADKLKLINYLRTSPTVTDSQLAEASRMLEEIRKLLLATLG
jgi:hypothetical protein